MKTIPVRTASASYSIFLERGLLDGLGALLAQRRPGSRAFVVSDHTVWPLYGGRMRASLAAVGVAHVPHVVPAGEPSKSGATLFELYAALAKGGFSRSDTVVALGGGVIGDLAGMAAATYLRGMGFVQVPTTLLAQVDSSIGGKVAVDLPEGKNLVGAFYQPGFVVIDPDVLATLPDGQFSSGMGEVIKHAAIANAALFERLERLGSRRALGRGLPGILAENLKIKRAVVERDEQDNGPRMVLNFGHTIGHALEKQAGYTGLAHGAAVAMGMCHITERSEAMGFTEPGTAVRLAALCRAFGLPDRLPDGSRQGLLATMALDKKVRGGTITLSLLRRVGQAELVTIPTARLEDYL